MRRASCFGQPWEVFPLSTTNNGSVTHKLIEDVPTPGFRALLKCGNFLPLNPVTIRTTTTEYMAHLFDHRRIWASGPCSGNVASTTPGLVSLDDGFPFSFEVPRPDDNVIRAVVNSAVADSRNHAWDVLTDAAELRETIHLFRSTAAALNTSAGKAVDKALKLAFRGPIAVSKAFASAWLQYRYGWMPLAYSLQDAVKALSASQQKFAIGRGTLSESDVFVLTSDASNCEVAAFTTETLTYERSYRGWASSQINWQNRYGFDPIKTAWELVPFSFVMDWFIQVGTWIEAFSPFAAGTLLGSMASIKTNSVYEVRRDIDARYCAVSNTNGTGSLHEVVYRQSVEDYVRFPYPPSLPSWNPRVNLPRMTDAISLAIGISTNTRRRLRV